MSACVHGIDLTKPCSRCAVGDNAPTAMSMSGAEFLASCSAEEYARVFKRALARSERARNDFEYFLEFVMRNIITGEPIQIAPHQRVACRFIQDHPLCALMWPVGVSKCVEESTLISDPVSGRQMTIADFTEKHPRARVHTWSRDKGVHSVEAQAKIFTGSKRCLRIRLASGRELVGTPEHPVFASLGWRRLDEVAIGDTVAVAARLPEPEAPQGMWWGDVDLLALLLAEGCTTQHRVGFSTACPIIRGIAERAAESIGAVLVLRTLYNYDFVHGARRRDKTIKNPVRELVKAHGMQGVGSRKKVVPEAIFSLPNEQLARFLAVFWMCDGYVSKQQVAVTLASKRLVEQLQHLLLRFGIQSSVRYKEATFDGAKFDAWRLGVHAGSVSNFVEHIPLWGEKERRARVIAAMRRNPNIGTPRLREDEAKGILERLCDVPVADARQSLGWTSKPGWASFLFGLPRETGHVSILPTALRATLEYLPELRPLLGHLFDGDISWDMVESIEEVGIRRVYDLTVAPTACFLANDIVAHNSFLVAAYLMWLIGNDPTHRCAVVSATQGQAEKIVGIFRDYVERSAELHLVFPALCKSSKPGDPWTQTKLIVERKMGIKDATLEAYGLDSKQIQGTRLSVLVIDDVLNQENTETPDGREKTSTWLYSQFESRLDPNKSRAIFTQTPWHPDDALHKRINTPPNGSGWACLRFDAYGDVVVYDSHERFLKAEAKGAKFESWTCPHLRPKHPGSNDPTDRLVAHDPDPNNEVVLWPEVQSLEWLEQKRRGTLPEIFNQQHRCIARSDETAMCKRSYIETCLKVARDLGVHDLVPSYNGGNLVFVGIDLAFSERDKSDDNAIFTFELRPDGKKVILDLDCGKWPVPVTVDKIFEKAKMFNATVITVESNSAQIAVVQFALERSTAIPVVPYQTGGEKADPTMGIPGLFLEMRNGGWAIPNHPSRGVNPKLQRFISGCLNYVPQKHTEDSVMACFLARGTALKWGVLGGHDPKSPRGGDQLSTLMMR